jgi:trimeric autotransporter adhesin
MNRLLSRLPAAGALALLAACGGGGSPPAAEPQAATVLISGRAVDGPLQGATACYDLDDNGACDAGEPRSAPTTADGAFTLSVPAARAGRHAVLVQVPAEAIDADTGAAVGRAFVMRAPASGMSATHSVFVSPLSTLVATRMATQGETREQASAAVQSAAGLSVSPLADFTGATPEQQAAARLARLVQLTAFAQHDAIASLQGQTDRQGRTLGAADLEREVQLALIEGLPALRDAARDADIAHAAGSAREEALRSAAGWLAGAIGPEAAQVLVAGTRQRLAEPPPADPLVPTGQLFSFSYTDVNNWTTRTFMSSAADLVPDANNQQRFYDRYQQKASTGVNANGVIHSWAGNSQRARAGDLHWDGSAWRGCATTDRYVTTVRDAQGRASTDFCFGLELNTSIRRLEDISGLRVQDFVRDRIRTFPGQGSFGPSNLALYGNITFPTGSYLIYQTVTASATAWTYDPRTSNELTITSANIAAGGDARQNPALECNGSLASVTASFVPATNLEDVIARNRGTPCIYNQFGTAPNQSTNPDEWWGNSTINVGDVPGLNTLPANTGNHYNTTAALRFSFSGGDRVRFHRCFRRTSDNSPRNCTPIGVGRYTITTLANGDRVLSLSTAPALAQLRLTYNRVLVERNGKVYYGFKSHVGRPATSLRINLPAANAIFQQLGMPIARPVTQPGTATGARAAALASLQGVWGSATATEARVFRFGADGRFFMAEAKSFDGTLRVQSGAELGWFDYDPSTQSGGTLLESDSNLTSGTSHGTAAPEPFDIAAFTAASNRLPTYVPPTGGNPNLDPPLVTDPAVLVGLWAVDTRSDLSTPHLVFFSNGKAMLVLHQEDANCRNGTAVGQCPPGVEYFDWTIDAINGTVTLSNPLYDTNGCQGFFQNCPANAGNNQPNLPVLLGLTFSNDLQSAAFVSSAGGSGTLLRIPNGN